MVLSPVNADSLEAFKMFVHINLTFGGRTGSSNVMGLSTHSSTWVVSVRKHGNTPGLWFSFHDVNLELERSVSDPSSPSPRPSPPGEGEPSPVPLSGYHMVSSGQSSEGGRKHARCTGSTHT